MLNKSLIPLTILALSLSALSGRADITGFGTGTAPASGSSSDNGTFTLNAGNCCGTPYAAISSDVLTLGGGNIAWGSAFADTAQTISTPFTSTFTFTQGGTGANDLAFSFALQNDSRGVKALDGDNVGYNGNGSPIENSVQVVFVVNTPNASDSSYASANSVGFLTNGTTGSVAGFAIPPADTAQPGLNFELPVTATVSYTGTTLSLSLAGTSIATMAVPAAPLTYTTSETINLATVLGGSTATVGFSSNQETDGVAISNFTFAGAPEPSALSFVLLGLSALVGVRFIRQRSSAKV